MKKSKIFVKNNIEKNNWQKFKNLI
jgi:hypothetical protein